MESKVKNLIEIRSLINYLNERTREYDTGHPTISDLEWDKAYFNLRDLENEYSIYYNDSPTQTISYEVVNSLEKITHNHDMLSLDKTKSLKDVKNFLGDSSYLTMCKMDGLTCSLKYENGILVSAETRGDGKIGENILHNARVIPSIPRQIPLTETLVIDGEIICTKKDFAEFEKDYANPRNFAAGSIRLLDAKECSKRKLQFIAWDVIEGIEDINSLYTKLSVLRTICGFITVPLFKSENTDDIESTINKLTEFADDLTYPIDGIVFKFDDIKYGRSLGKTSHHFKNALAYKFHDETEFTKLINIEWSVGRTGQVTPIAIFEPVELDGSTISRATLHNISMIDEIFGGPGPFIGQEIEIYKANMITPQIKSAKDTDKGTVFYMGVTFLEEPDRCPICGEVLERKAENDSIFLYCMNSSCDGKLINKLDYFCGKKGLDIKGLSKATLEKLINWGWVSRISDIFALSQYQKEWIEKPGFGKKSVNNILEAIEKSKNCTLNSYICSLGIPLIGSSVSKDLIKAFPTWEEFIGAVESKYHFWELPNFGPEMHQSIINFDYTEAKEIYDKYLNIELIDIKNNNSLNGLVFVITGKINNFKNRDELKSLIESKGGKVTGSISGKTNYLINNDTESTSSKNLSAKKLGVTIISEEKFIEMFM